MTSQEPRLIEAQTALDDRGQLTFSNSFDFKGIQRFYAVENFSTQVIRAWHGHLKESKYLFMASGSAIVAAVLLDDIKNPGKKNPVHLFVLSSKKPGLLYIPQGFANGFRFLEKGTKVIIFSTSSLEESKGDDYRFPHDYWGDEVWTVKNR